MIPHARLHAASASSRSVDPLNVSLLCDLRQPVGPDPRMLFQVRDQCRVLLFAWIQRQPTPLRTVGQQQVHVLLCALVMSAPKRMGQPGQGFARLLAAAQFHASTHQPIQHGCHLVFPRKLQDRLDHQGADQVQPFTLDVRLQ